MKSIRNRLSFVATGLVASLTVGGAASAADAPAVEWKVSDGGNGHWYQVKLIGPLAWNQAKLYAESFGGHLATVISSEEHAKIRQAILSAPNFGEDALGKMGPWLGGYQDRNASDYSEPRGGWRWITGETWWPNWSTYQPDNGCGFDGSPEDYLNIIGLNAADESRFNDLPNYGCGVQRVVSCVVEWEVDCNEDGVVDYGQIQSGELADTNHNNIPDVCELVITSVQPISGPSTGGTAVKINGNNFPTSPTVTFGGVAATDIVRVTPSLITAVTPAGTPGMTLVTVNGASSESFYYRPSCGSDLDNSGVVDSGDISIVLLDFGSCSDSLTTAQEQELLIFQSAEPAKALKK
jgi:hypothetical protein